VVRIIHLVRCDAAVAGAADLVFAQPPLQSKWLAFCRQNIACMRTASCALGERAKKCQMSRDACPAICNRVLATAMFF